MIKYKYNIMNFIRHILNKHRPIAISILVIFSFIVLFKSFAKMSPPPGGGGPTCDGAPCAPTSLAASPNDGRVALTWSINPASDAADNFAVAYHTGGPGNPSVVFSDSLAGTATSA